MTGARAAGTGPAHAAAALAVAATLCATATAEGAPDREPNGGAGPPSISADGARVAFDSDATNLVRRDTNGETTDPFVRDLAQGFTAIGDRTRGRRHALRGGRYRRGPGFALSAGGRFLVFSSSSPDLGRGSGHTEIWRRDLLTGETALVSVAPGGADGDSESPAISPDGRYVVFESRATNLVPEDDYNLHTDVYWRDVDGRVTLRASVPLAETDTPGRAGSSLEPTVSAGGRFVAFTNDGGNLVAASAASATVYRRDMTSGVTEPVDVPPPAPGGEAGGGAPPPPQGGGEHPAISADGRFVLFDSDATDLPGAADNGSATDVLVRDMESGAVTAASRASGGEPAAGDSTAGSLTPDGRFAAFSSLAPNLAPGDSNGTADVFVRDLASGETRRVSSVPDGSSGDGPSIAPAASADGRFVAFLTRAPGLSGQPPGPVRVVRKDLATGALATVTVGLDNRPRTLIGAPAGGSLARRHLRFFEGTASDDFLVTKVELAVSRRERGRCLWLTARRARFVERPCRRPLYIPARLRSNLRFTHRFRGLLPRGDYTVRSRATDDGGLVERRVSPGRNRVRFRLT